MDDVIYDYITTIYAESVGYYEEYIVEKSPSYTREERIPYMLLEHGVLKVTINDLPENVQYGLLRWATANATIWKKKQIPK